MQKLAVLVFGAAAIALVLSVAGCGVIGADVLNQYWLDKLSAEVATLQGDVQTAFALRPAAGPTGSTGPTGATGAMGPTGPQGDPGVLARAQISAGGSNLTPSDQINAGGADPDVVREATGKYRVRIHVGFDVSQLPSDAFPVVVTPHPAPFNPGADVDPFTASVQQIVIDTDPTTVEYRVHLHAQPLNAAQWVYRNSDFSFVLREMPAAP